MGDVGIKNLFCKSLEERPTDLIRLFRQHINGCDGLFCKWAPEEGPQVGYLSGEYGRHLLEHLVGGGKSEGLLRHLSFLCLAVCKLLKYHARELGKKQICEV